MWNSWVDEVCSARDLWSDESQVLKAGKVRSWSFDMLLSGVDVGGQVTVMLMLDCVDFVFKGSSKGIVNVDAIFVLICLRAEEGNSDVGARCNDVESRYGLCLSIDFMRILLCWRIVVMPPSIYGSW